MGDKGLLGSLHRLENRKGISTYIAVILLIVLAVAVGLIIWAYTMGWLGVMGINPRNNAMQIQGVTIENDHLLIYVNNIGNGDIKLTPPPGSNSHVYINDVAKTYTLVESITSLPPTQTCTLSIATSILDPAKSGLTNTIKIIADDGTTASGQYKLDYVHGYTTTTTLDSITTPMQQGLTGVVFSGQVASGTAVPDGAPVILQYSTSPSGPWTTAATVATTAGTGAFTGTFTAPIAGTYYFQAYFAEYISGTDIWAYSASTPQTVTTITGTVHITTTTLNPITTPLQAGGSGVSFSGTVASTTAVPDGAVVNLEYSTSPSGPWTTLQAAAITGGAGAFSGTFTAPSAGTYYVQAHFTGHIAGSDGWSSSVSPQLTIVTVAGTTHPTTTTLNPVTTPIQQAQTGVTFSGTVASSTAVPNGATVSLDYSSSTSGPWTSLASAQTSGSNGAYSGTFTAPTAGTYYIRASFGGFTQSMTTWSASTSNQQTIIAVTGTVYTTTVTLNTITTPLTAGQTGVAFAGSVSSTPAVPNGGTVSLQYSTSPSGPWTTAATATTTGGTGAFSGTFNAPVAGTYYFQAYFGGAVSAPNGWSSSVSPQQTILVTGSGGSSYSTSATLNSIQTPVGVGQTGVAFSGTISASVAVPNGVTVTLQYSTSPSGPWTTATTVTTTGGTGAFSGTFTAPASAGTYYFQAYFGGYTSGSTWTTSTSAQQTILVNSGGGSYLSTSTTLNTITTPLQAGQTSVAFSGSVTATPNVPDGGTVTLQYSSSPSGPWSSAGTATTSGGTGSFSGTFTAPSAGTYYFKASFAGSSGANTWLASESAQQTVIIVSGTIYPTTTTLNAISTPLQAGTTNVAFSGLVTASTSVPNGATISLRYSTSPSGPWTTAATATTTGGTGAFSGTFTAPASAGTYYLQAYFGGYTSGSNGWSASTSAQRTVVVVTGLVYTTTTTLNVITTPLQVGAPGIAFSGTVSSTTSVPNSAPIVLQYSTSPSGPWTTAQTVLTTGGTGAFSGTFTAPAAGTYYFQAYFASFASGANTWSSSTSALQTIVTVSGNIYTTTTTLNTISTPLQSGQTGVTFSGLVSASTAVPNGAQVILRYSTSPSGPWTTAATVSTTGGNGAFSGTFTAPASAGTYYFQAYFGGYTSGSNGWSVSASAQQTIVISSGTVILTTTTLNTITTPLIVGQTNVAFSGTVSGTVPVVNNAPVVLRYSTSPSGPWTTAQTVLTTGGTGAFSGTFTAPAAGTYYFQAYFASFASGANTWSSSTSALQTITVISGTIYPTTTTLNTLPTPVGMAQTGVTFSGQVSATTAVPNGVSVVLRYSTSPSGPWTTAATVTTTGGTGAFSGTFTTPSSAGTYYFQAYFAGTVSGSNGWSASTSAQQTITVSAGIVYLTTTSLNTITTPLLTTQTPVSFSGQVTATTAVPNGAPVVLQYSTSPSGPWTTATTVTTTGGTGAFSGSFTAPGTAGTYYYQAYFATYVSGATWSQSVSPMRTVIVVAQTVINTGFEGTTWDSAFNDWNNPPWRAAPGQGYGGTTAATSDYSDDGPFTSDALDTRSGNTIVITFKWRTYQTESNDFRILYCYAQNVQSGPSYPGSNNPDFVVLGTLSDPTTVTGAVNLGGGWYQMTYTITRSATPSAFTQYFRIRFETWNLQQQTGMNEQVWVDDVIVAINP
jgi:hypothetical protein